MKNLILPLVLLVLGVSCNPKQEVDYIVHNANIYTVDSTFSKACCIAVKNGEIVGVGANADLFEDFKSDSLVDALGKTIVPGLIDAHCHFYGLGLNQQVVDLVGTQSFDEVLDRVQSFYDNNPSLTVVQGRGWDQNDWAVKEFPTNLELNKMFANIPVVLERVDGHAYLVNNAALNLAGIDKTTVVEGGKIIRENSGHATGVLVDAPMALVDAVLPKPSKEIQIQALKEAQDICFDYGLTTVNDAGLNKDVIELIDSLQQVGDLKIKVYAMVSNTKANLDYYLDKGIVKTNRLNVRSVKVYGDGALGSRGAALKEEYSDHEGHFGAMITPADKMESLAARIAATDYQMNTHAIGDSANIVALKAYEKALEGKKDRRWKIEHAQVLTENDFDYFEKGVIPSIQPTHATSDMYWAEDRLGTRVKGAYAYKTLLDKAGIVALGTDFPVERVSPFLTFYAAVARQDLEKFPAGGFQMKDALSREETLKGMTIWAAYSNFEENEKGSIEVGKKADFTVLSHDIMTVSTDSIPLIKAEQVFVEGERVK